MAKTVKVRLLCAVTHGSKGGRKEFAPGDVVALPPELAEELLEQGAVELADRVMKPLETLEDPAASPQAQLGSLLEEKARKVATTEENAGEVAAAAGDTPEA